MTKAQTFANVWDAIEDTAEDAAAMTLRSNLMMAITYKVRKMGGSQREVAGRLGITQPRLNDLLQGRISKFSLDALVNLAERADLRVKLDIRPIPEARRGKKAA
jgi:predicted XRE-type DNA-binding protein